MPEPQQIRMNIISHPDEQAAAFNENIGKIIISLEITGNELLFTCENRDRLTDCDPCHFIGAILQGAEIREDPDKGRLLIIFTSKGRFIVGDYNDMPNITMIFLYEPKGITIWPNHNKNPWNYHPT